MPVKSLKANNNSTSRHAMLLMAPSKLFHTQNEFCKKSGETPEKKVANMVNSWHNISRITNLYKRAEGITFGLSGDLFWGEAPMRSFLAVVFAVLALSMVNPALACPPGYHPCGPACCPNR